MAALQEELEELTSRLRVSEEKLAASVDDCAALQAQLNELGMKQGTLSWDMLMATDDSFPLKSFTGFSTKEKLSAFYNLLNHDNMCDRVMLYRDSSSLDVSSAERDRRVGESRGRDRRLSPRDGVALTLVMLRTGMTFKVTAALFGVSGQTASRHFTTWLVLLEFFLSSEFPYPTVEQLKRVTPSSVQEALGINMDGIHFEAFIDCHEQECETPTSKLAHKKVWSEYKHRTTFKFFGAIGGNGAFTFASTAYRGRLTDPVVTRLCGYMDLIHEHGATGADKGFDMIADFSSKKALLVIPPKAFAGQAFFTSDEMVDTANIARSRIHVERAFKRAQEYKILHNKIPVTMFDIWGSIFRVCCFLTNFEAPLIQDK